ncbi:hypothetical protein [Streptomyces tubercidicus]|uniref:hypothetical protein n=1 Tax=Streptomyces tubercidicus TaxID=47759 RepID=UPI0036A9211F
MAGAAAVGLLLAGCNPGGEGVRSEGAASSTPVPPKGPVRSTPSPASPLKHKKVDAVQLLKDDPKVGAFVKKSLAKPCAADEYPVEVTYASLTGSTSPDVIVNVMTCADSVGIGSYVYRKHSGTKLGYDNVYTNEQPSVSVAVNKGELEVSRQTYERKDKLCCPSGEDVTPLRWKDGRFIEHDGYHTDYSKTTVDGGTSGDGTGSEG